MQDGRGQTLSCWRYHGHQICRTEYFAGRRTCRTDPIFLINILAIKFCRTELVEYMLSIVSYVSSLRIQCAHLGYQYCLHLILYPINVPDVTGRRGRDMDLNLPWWYSHLLDLLLCYIFGYKLGLYSLVSFTLVGPLSSCSYPRCLAQQNLLQRISSR